MNRSLIGLTVFSILLFGAAVPLIAQGTRSSKDEAPAIVGLAERKLDNISFRVVVTTEWFDRRGGDVFNSSTETFAIAFPDRFHSITENGGTRIETLVIEDKTYRRTNDEDWESVAVPPIRRAGSIGAVARFGPFEGGASLPAGNGKFVARGTIDGQDVTQYETRKVLSDSIENGSTRVETISAWINERGLIIRKIVEHETVGDRRIMRATYNYTYGDISITAPVIP